jgi:hypothetical protein
MDSGHSWSSFPEARQKLGVFACHADPLNNRLVRSEISGRLFGCTNYVGITGQNLETNDGLFPSIFQLKHDTLEINDQRIRIPNVSDGLSNTIALGERPIAARAFVGSWFASQEYGHQSIGVSEDVSRWRTNRSVYLTYHPHDECSAARFKSGTADNVCDQFHPWSYHSGGASFCRADGSVHFTAYTIDSNVLNALATIDGHETINEL